MEQMSKAVYELNSVPCEECSIDIYQATERGQFYGFLKHLFATIVPACP